MREIFRQDRPRSPLGFTGERLTTAVGGQLQIEHYHRYFLAREICRGKEVLDIASGEGYGTAFLAQVAHSVTGVELMPEVAAHAARAYSRSNLRFVAGDVRSIPLRSASIDVVVSFETLEHIYEHDTFVAEIRRVMRPGGVLIMSTPDKAIYSPSGTTENQFHVRELTREEFTATLRRRFSHVTCLAQRSIIGAAILPDPSARLAASPITFERLDQERFEVSEGLPRAPYIIAVASDHPIELPLATLYIESGRLATEEIELVAAQERVRELSREVAIARQLLANETHQLWNSSSWRLLQPLRNLALRRRGGTIETEPVPASMADAIRTNIVVRQSLSWELTSPLRILHRIFSRARAAGRSRVDNREARSVAGPVAGVLTSTQWQTLRARGALLPWRNAPADGARRPRIVFAMHEASRTGAPLILLSLVRHFAHSGNYELFVFCDKPGPLLEAFSEHAHVIDRSRHDLFASSPTIEDLIGAFGNDRPVLAICNTAVVNHYAMAFAQFRIPLITLVHEMAEGFSESHLREIYAASDRVIFPAEFVRMSAHQKAALPTGKALVLPQGLLDPNFAAGNHAEARRAVLDELHLPDDAFIVLGCGMLDLRKGIDLFVELAETVGRLSNEAPIYFVWIGAKGDDPVPWVENDIAARRLGERVHLLGERETPAPYYIAANAFALTSRADPFPCVVHEAMAAETPVIAFSGVGGAPEALEGGCGIIVPFGDIAAMAEAVLAFYRDADAAKRMAALAKERVLTRYRFEDYFGAIVRLAHDELGVPLPEAKSAPAAASTRSQSEKSDFQLVRKDADFDASFYLPPSAPRLSRDQAIEQFMREYATTGAGRKPCSGFNPQSYAEQAMQPRELETRNPLAHFIEQGKPQGPWLTPLIRATKQSPGATRLRTAMHLHAYYPDLIDEFMGCLAGNLSRCDLFVTTGREEDLARLKKSLASYDRGAVEVAVVPNRGRDIGPFLTHYQWLNKKYDLLGHLHCKKTANHEAAVGETWRHFLWWNLLGDKFPMLDVIAREFEHDERLGLVFPDDPHIVGWWANKEHAQGLAQKMGLTGDLPQSFEFPVGTMFWCRPEALRPLFELRLSWDDYPAEPVPIDGTILHAIERMLPFVAQNQGYRIAATNVPGVTR